MRIFGSAPWQQPAVVQSQPMPITSDTISSIVGGAPAPMGMAPSPVESIVSLQPEPERRGLFRHSPPKDLSPSALPIEMFDAAELLG